MNPRVERSINRIAEQARSRYVAMLDAARNQTEQAAGVIRNGKKPVKTLSRFGVKLTDVSHRATARVVKQQAVMVEHQIDALATGLRAAANADGLGDLVRGQFRRIPATASQLLTDGRATLSIVAEAGGEVRQLVAGTVAELRGRSKAPRKASKKAAPTKAAKAKSKPRAKASKKVSKKTTTRAKATPAAKAATGNQAEQKAA